MTDRDKKDIMRLLAAVEQTFGRAIAAPGDFAALSADINSRSDGHDNISVSTLKRLWGYVRYEHTPSDAALSVLARYCGYRDRQHFKSSPHPDSGFLVMNPILSSSLGMGDRLEISWAPDRLVRLLYLGDNTFRVTDSLNAKLVAGDIFTATVFCRGYPLYATEVRRGCAVIGAYIAAKKDGLLSVRVLPDGCPVNGSGGRQ